MDLRLVCAITLFACHALHAAPKFEGGWKWEFANDGASIAMSADAIINPSKENATGTIQVQLWATSAPYTGGNINGKIIATTKLDGLKAGQFYRNFRKTVDYTGPAKGTYFVTLVLTEFRNNAYSIVDWRTTSNTHALAPLKPFTLGGAVSWKSSIEGGTVDINVGKISHHQKGTTGSLKLAVWVTKQPYNGDELRGWEIGSVIKDGLKPGFSYNDVKNVAKYVPPPAGTFYSVIVLYEFRSDKTYHLVDWRTLGGTSKFN